MGLTPLPWMVKNCDRPLSRARIATQPSTRPVQRSKTVVRAGSRDRDESVCRSIVRIRVNTRKAHKRAAPEKKPRSTLIPRTWDSDRKPRTLLTREATSSAIPARTPYTKSREFRSSIPARRNRAGRIIQTRRISASSVLKRKTSLFKAGEKGIRIRAPSRKRAGRKAYKKERGPGRIKGGSKRKIGISHRRAKRIAMADAPNWNRPLVPP